MAKGIFTTKVYPKYDDLLEVRYHFPKTYLNQVRETIGDWIVYYEPRRQDADPSGRFGRQVYFATARVERIESDPNIKGHYYAFVKDYLEFNNSVPFKLGEKTLEIILTKKDGATNKGAFGRAVRLMSDDEYQTILRLGFDNFPESLSDYSGTFFAEYPAEYDRPIVEQLTRRPFRDAAFTRTVIAAYEKTCAVTGFRLINGGGRCEVEAAHIRPVGDNHNGPDSVRNGIALSRTIHWMFDRGILSFTDDCEILMVQKLIPDDFKPLITPERKISLPSDLKMKPHPLFLKYHRENIFKG